VGGGNGCHVKILGRGELKERFGLGILRQGGVFVFLLSDAAWLI